MTRFGGVWRPGLLGLALAGVVLAFSASVSGCVPCGGTTTTSAGSEQAPAYSSHNLVAMTASPADIPDPTKREDPTHGASC